MLLAICSVVFAPDEMQNNSNTKIKINKIIFVESCLNEFHLMKYEIAKVKIWVKFGKRLKPQNIVLVFISKVRRFEKFIFGKRMSN